MSDVPPTLQPEGVVARLRRRKVVQWGVAYVAGAWGLLQAIGFIADAFSWPQATKQVALFVLLIGLPIVLVLAWYHGDKGEHRVTRTEFAILTVLFLLGGGLFWYYEPSQLTAKPTARAEDRIAPPGSRSIAVLPFVNMSPDRDQEYFADGISEELLNLLAKVPQLQVIARTSSFSFKGKDADIAEIARTLNVAHVLEGSVRTSGDKVRITAQLIRASDSSRLWSQTYDRELTDVFVLQDEIATAVVSQLKVALLGEAPKTRVTDPKAYALFLHGRELVYRYSAESLQEAIALFRQALEIDPAYAPALTWLGNSYWGQIDLGLLPLTQGRALCVDALDRAIAADPSYAPAHASLGMVEALMDRNYASAARRVERAFALDPSNLDAVGTASSIARRLMRLDLALALAEYKLSRDPINIDGFDSLALAYRYKGELDKSAAAYRALLNLSPDAGWEHMALGLVLLQQGDARAALSEFQKETIESFRLGGYAMAYHALDKRAESDAALAELERKYPETRPFNIATILAYRGDIDGAFQLLDKAAQLNDTDLGALPAQPDFAVLHKDPRWLPFLRRLGIAPEQLAAIRFDVKVPP